MDTNTTTDTEWTDAALKDFIAILMITIIVASLMGNFLIIVSVMRHKILSNITNYFVVSLAFADMLIALFVMTLNFSMHLYGRWLFGNLLCKVLNSMDVYLSTVSILHLCCISVDRYIAIIKPLKYILYMKESTVYLMLVIIWTTPLVLIIPIFMEWHTTENYLKNRSEDQCTWVVNKPYGIISSSISFWIPCTIMVCMNLAIFREANRQEKIIFSKQKNALLLQQRNADSDIMTNSEGSSKNLTIHEMNQNSRRTCTEDRNLIKMKREYKAAKTLGIMMGVFILCWLPFFTWYVTTTICDKCWNPPFLNVLMFWIGYTNSILNPIIHAYFNRDFKEAFKNTFRCLFCSYYRRRSLELDTLDLRRSSLRYADRIRCVYPKTNLKNIEEKSSKYESSFSVNVVSGRLTKTSF